MFSSQLWPEQIRSVCGCTVDALRHSITFEEVVEDNPLNPKVQVIVDGTLPICVEEEKARAENSVLGG